MRTVAADDYVRWAVAAARSGYAVFTFRQASATGPADEAHATRLLWRFRFGRPSRELPQLQALKPRDLIGREPIHPWVLRMPRFDLAYLMDCKMVHEHTVFVVIIEDVPEEAALAPVADMTRARDIAKAGEDVKLRVVDKHVPIVVRDDV